MRWYQKLVCMACFLGNLCSGGLVLQEDVGHFTAGTEIIDQVEQAVSTVGRGIIPSSVDPSNVSVAVVSVSEMENICWWKNSTLNYSANVFVTDFSAYFLCNQTILCALAPIWIQLAPGSHLHGWYHYSGIRGGGCDNDGLFAMGIGIDSLVESVSGHKKAFRASLKLGQSDLTRLRDSWYFKKMYSRGILPFCAIVIAALSVIVFLKLRARKNLTCTHVLILVLNIIQGVALMFIHFVGCTHFLNDFCSHDVQVKLWSEFGGTTLFTNLLYVVLLQNIIRCLQQGRKAPGWQRKDVCTWAIGAWIALGDFFFMSGSGYLGPKAQFIVGLMAVATSLGVFAYVVSSYSQLSSILRASCTDVPQSKFTKSVLTLAARFDYYTRYTIASALGILISTWMFTFGLYYSTYVGYLVHIMLLDISKLVNMYSQIMVVWPVDRNTSSVSVSSSGRNKYVDSTTGGS